MDEKSIPEKVLDVFISSLKGNKFINDNDLKKLLQLLKKDEVNKKEVTDFIKMEGQQ